MQRLVEPGSLVHSYNGDRNIRAAYEIDAQPLGEGRYSRVFGATHRSTGARRAIKTADRQGQWTQYVDLGMECPGRLASHEANILRRLDHPNIIRIIEVFEEKKAVHLVLELCEGGDVLERILVSNGRLPEADISRLFIQMLFAVWHLHQNGVVHRDLKPEHFLFTRREPGIEPRPPEQATMKLIDFGLSHKIGVGFAPDGGTPQFMSPEAKDGKTTKELADRSDMWSLGVVLHAMLVGHYPSPHLSDAKQPQYFSRPAWKDVSAHGIEMIGLLLRQQPSARPSAADCLKLPWAQAAFKDYVNPPDALLRTVAPAIKSYGGAKALRRLALAAVAHEIDDNDVVGLRQVMQTLEMRCGGPLVRSGLLRAASAGGPLGDTAQALFRSFDAIVKGSDTMSWSELVAVFMCAGAKGQSSHTPAVRDEACWRAFDLLSFGTGSVSASSLDQLLQNPKGSEEQKPADKAKITSASLNRMIQEVFSGGTICYTDFLKLARGDLQRGSAGAAIGSFLGCCRCSRDSPVQEVPPLPPAGAPLMAPPSSMVTGPNRPQEKVLNSEIGAPRSPSEKEKKKKRSPLSILGMTSL